MAGCSLVASLAVADTAPVRLGLGLAGLFGGALWTGLALFPPEGEVVRNRLWTLALLGMCLGVLGLSLAWRSTVGRVGRVALSAAVVGLGLMTLGNLVEYWMLSSFPHEGGAGAIARGLAWMTFLLGVLLLAIGSLVAGVSMFRTSSASHRLATLCVLVVPATMVGAVAHPGVAALPLALLASAVLVIRPSPPQLRSFG